MTVTIEPGGTYLRVNGYVLSNMQPSDMQLWDEPIDTPLFEPEEGGVYRADGKNYFCDNMAGALDAVQRSPWDTVRAELSDIAPPAIGLGALVFYDARRDIRERNKLTRYISFAEGLSEALEFVSWAEQRGLIPDNIGDLSIQVEP